MMYAIIKFVILEDSIFLLQPFVIINKNLIIFYHVRLLCLIKGSELFSNQMGLYKKKSTIVRT